MRTRKLLESKRISELITVEPECTLVNAARLLHEKRIGALPVINRANALVGIVSERDLVRGLARFEAAIVEKKVSDVMTSSVLTCTEEDNVDRIYDLMTRRRIRHMPVVRGSSLVGILSVRDFESAYKYLVAHSVTDDITGMVNLRSFVEQLDSEFNRFRRFQLPVAVIAVKVGGYDDYVRGTGQESGEDLLRGLAEAMDRETRNFDVVGHVSDDEFGIILPSTKEKSALRACARIVAAARDSFPKDDAAAIVVGVGLAFAGPDTRDSASILENARKLAATAVSRGGNRFEVEPGSCVQTPGEGQGLAAAE